MYPTIIVTLIKSKRSMDETYGISTRLREFGNQQDLEGSAECPITPGQVSFEPLSAGSSGPVYNSARVDTRNTTGAIKGKAE